MAGTYSPPGQNYSISMRTGGRTGNADMVTAASYAARQQAQSATPVYTGAGVGAGAGGSNFSAGFEGADPFGSQRAGYQAMLKTGMTSGDPYGGWGDKMQSLMNGQFDATDPSYKWRYEQGLQATQRAGAAKGLGASGNEMLALQEAGQGMASQEYGNQFNRLYSLMGQSAGQFNATMDRLANLSGAQFSPAAPFQLGMQKYSTDVGAATNLATAQIAAQTAQSRLSAGTSTHSWVDPYTGQAAERGAAAALQGYVPEWQRSSSSMPMQSSFSAPTQTPAPIPPPSLATNYAQQRSAYAPPIQSYYTASPFVNQQSAMPDFSNVQTGFSSTGGY